MRANSLRPIRPGTWCRNTVWCLLIRLSTGLCVVVCVSICILGVGLQMHVRVSHGVFIAQGHQVVRGVELLLAS